MVAAFSHGHSIYLVLLVVLATTTPVHTSKKPFLLVPRPDCGNTAAIWSTATDISRLTAAHITDAQQLSPQAARAFIHKLATAAAATAADTAEPGWKPAEQFAYALPAYLRKQHLDGVLQLMQQLASGATPALDLDNQLREAAAKLKPLDFTSWARRSLLPAIPTGRHTSHRVAGAGATRSLMAPVSKAALTSVPASSPSRQQQSTATKDGPAGAAAATTSQFSQSGSTAARAAPMPYKVILDPFTQFADWKQRLRSLGGNTSFLAATLKFPPPKPTNPSLNAGIRTFKARRIGLVFHIMLFQDSKGYLYPPQAYWNGAEPAQHMVNIVNHMFRYSGTNLQFYIKAYRSSAAKYPYLKFRNLLEWQNCGLKQRGCTCGLAAKRNMAPDKYINIYVIGSTSYYLSTQSVTPYATTTYTAAIPGVADTCKGRSAPWHRTRTPPSQHIWLLWDQFNPLAANSDFSGNAGAAALAHELGHALGLLNTYSDKQQCVDSDLVADTPAEIRDPYADLDDLGQLCADLTLSSPLRKDDISGLDGCPTQPGGDNVFNIMGYGPTNCRFYFTRGQVWRMQQILTKHLPRYGR